MVLTDLKQFSCKNFYKSIDFCFVCFVVLLLILDDCRSQSPPLLKQIKSFFNNFSEQLLVSVTFKKTSFCKQSYQSFEFCPLPYFL